VKTTVGIALGPPWVKVNVTKNRKMVSKQKLELGMRYCNQTWCIASLSEDPVGIAFGPLGSRPRSPLLKIKKWQ
jgi:hypothetical protein